MHTANDIANRDVKRLLKAIYNPCEGERHNAADLLYNSMQRLGVHPEQVAISVRDPLYDKQASVIEYQQKELLKLGRAVEFFRRHAQEAICKDAIKAELIEYRWPEFEQLVAERIDGGLKFGWKLKVSSVLGIAPYMVSRWEAGTHPIPEAHFDTLRALPKLSPTISGANGARSDDIDAQISEILSRKGRYARFREAVFYAIQKTGTTGATANEVAKILGWRQEEYKASPRIWELEANQRIFIVGKRLGSRSQQNVYVAAEFKENYPEQWDESVRRFKGKVRRV